MKKLYSIFFAVCLSLIFSSIAIAQDPEPGTRTPVVRKRQGNQQQRIRQGVRSGELTRKEVKILQKDQQEIRQDKREAKSDGTVTVEERRDIRKDQNKASRQIYRAKHNRRDRN